MATKSPLALFELASFVLQDVFGFGAFRGVQEQVIRRLLVDSKNALCLMPTGGGKSLTYQIPAVCLPGLTIVVSPLIALMKDQVDALRKRDVCAASMDSSLSPEDMSTVRSQLKDKSLKLLYVAPERLSNEMFVELMYEQEVSLLAVDESHCVSEWGPSFRPTYLKVARFAKEVNAQRVLCLTATATPSVVTDICDAEKGFDISVDQGVFKTGNYRSNLALQILPCVNRGAKLAALIPFLKARRGGASIIYITTQHESDELATSLKASGVDCKPYHAGMKAEDRKSTQDWFIAGEGVVVATIAFGMGIDKSNIRQVVHFNIPKTLENYSQEIGRAGRDGLPAQCLMLPSPADLPILESFARGNTPSRNSIHNWLTEVLSTKPDKDGSIDFSHYTQASECDISRNTLGLLYANLELESELLRATTPFYSTYSLKSTSKEPQRISEAVNDPSPIAQAIRKHWKKGTIWYNIDVMAVVENEKVDRSDVIKVVNRWQMQGSVETKVANVRDRYLVTSTKPKSKADIEKIADDMFKQMVDREEADVKRLEGVVDFIRRKDCYAHGLACYFGDETSVPGGKCGSCTWCKSKVALTFPSKPKGHLDESKIRTVLDICGVRDDARFLARLAFGISSPRITKLGLSRHVVFGSCETADFSALVARFEDECEKANWTNRALLSSAPPSQEGSGKRPSTGSSSTPKKGKKE